MSERVNPPESSARAGKPVYADVPLDSVKLPGELLRQHVDEDALEGLRRSIASRGVLVPLVVVAEGRGYRLVAGLRRYLAASAVGLATVPALVVEGGAEWEAWATLAENGEREAVNAIDEAVWIAGRMEALGVGQRELAAVLDVSEAWVSQRLAVFSWPDDVRGAVRECLISFSVGRELAGIADGDVRAYCLDTARRCGCSVRQAAMWRQNWARGRSDSVPRSPGSADAGGDASSSGGMVCGVCLAECEDGGGLLQFVCSRCLQALEAARSASSDVIPPLSA